jgi:hypothetical protein
MSGESRPHQEIQYRESAHTRQPGSAPLACRKIRLGRALLGEDARACYVELPIAAPPGLP